MPTSLDRGNFRPRAKHKQNWKLGKGKPKIFSIFSAVPSEENYFPQNTVIFLLAKKIGKFVRACVCVCARACARVRVW